MAEVTAGFAADGRWQLSGGAVSLRYLLGAGGQAEFREPFAGVDDRAA
jgi:hypothetical protein